MTHLREAWAGLVEASGPARGPNDSIYRGLRQVMIPFDPEVDAGLSGRQIADRAIKQLRSEGYGPEHPGNWWMVNNDDAERLRLAKWWSSHFGVYMGKDGKEALIGFVYEARFTARPPPSVYNGNSLLPVGLKIRIIAVHVTNTRDAWERIPVDYTATIT